MKKMISFILAAAMSAMVAVPALAAAPTTTANGDNTWTTAGEDAAYAGKMMTMVAYEGGEITVDSIQYIDQTTADGNGSYAFSNYTPKTLPTTVDYKVKVGGETLTTALDAGVIKGAGEVETTIAISGKVSTLSGAANATIAFCTPGTTEAVATATTSAGAFEIEVAAGTYDIVISRPGYLSYTILNAEVADGFTLADVKLTAGNVDGNNIVNADDFTMIISAFGCKKGDAGYTAASDLDANEVVNADDFTAVISNFGATK